MCIRDFLYLSLLLKPQKTSKKLELSQEVKMEIYIIDKTRKIRRYKL